MVVITLSVILLFGLVALICYAPAIYHSIKLRALKKQFNEQLAYLNSQDYVWNTMIITDRLGEGGSQGYTTTTFADVQKYQQIATNSVLELMKRSKMLQEN